MTHPSTTPPDELTAEMICPHGERCCQGEPCNGPQTTCWHCKSEVPAVDNCPVCDGDGSVLDLEYVHGLARLAAERGERIRALEKETNVTPVVEHTTRKLREALTIAEQALAAERASHSHTANMFAAERAKVAELTAQHGHDGPGDSRAHVP
jgi:hypothetical protein